VDAVLARIPPAARPNTQAGAEAFGRWFIEQVAKSWTKADPTLLDGLFDTNCRACTSYRAAADDLRAAGLRHASAALTVESSSANVFDGARVEIAVPLTQNAIKVVNRQGTSVRMTKPDEGTVVLTLRWAEHWIVRRAQVEFVR
jgi:hypothetical protein